MSPRTAIERDSSATEQDIPVVLGRVSYLPSAAPHAYTVQPGPRFDLVEERGDGYVVIHDVPSGIYGCGESPARAQADFKQAAHEHLDVLNRQPDLSEDLRWQRDYLRVRLGFRH